MRKRKRPSMWAVPYARTNVIDMTLPPSRVCQYMVGGDLKLVCGRPSIPDYSYCRKHKEMCYLPPRR